MSNQRVYATIGPVGLACRKPNRFEAYCRSGLSLARFSASGRHSSFGAGRSEEDAFASPGGGLDRNFGRDGVVLTPNFGR